MHGFEDILREQLYLEYLAEIEKYTERGSFPEGVEERREWARSYLSDPGCIWIDLAPPGELAIAGFLVVGKHGTEHCHPEADWFVCQSYVRPRYRRQGIMGRAVGGFVDAHAGTYALHVLRRNTAAQAFWATTFLGLGYTMVPMADCSIVADDEDYLLWTFSPDIV